MTGPEPRIHTPGSEWWARARGTADIRGFSSERMQRDAVMLLTGTAGADSACPTLA